MPRQRLYGRLTAFLNLPEQNQQDTAATTSTSISSTSLTALSPSVAPPLSVAGYRRAPTVTLANATFAWPAATKGDDEPVTVLKNVSAVIPAGKLTMIS